MDEIKKIISVDTDKAQKSLKDFKSEIDALRAKLLQLDSASSEYASISAQIAEKQNRLNEVMKIGKTNASALEGSYNALVNKLKTLKTQWRETNDEGLRTSLGKQINDINNELKNLDASVGNFSRNVGNYGGEFEKAFVKCLGSMQGLSGPIKDMANMFAQMIPMFRNIQITGVGAFTAIKGAIATTGIGLVAVAIGEIINKLTELHNKSKQIIDDGEDAYQQLLKNAEKYNNEFEELDARHKKKLKENQDNYDKVVASAEEKANKLRSAAYQSRWNKRSLLEKAEKQELEEKAKAEKALYEANLKETEDYNREYSKLTLNRAKNELELAKATANAIFKTKEQEANKESATTKEALEKQKEYYKDYYNTVTKAQENYMNVLESQRPYLSNEEYQELHQKTLNETTLSQIEMENQLDSYSTKIKSTLSQTSATVDKYQENYDRATRKIELETKERLFTTDRDVEDENERQEKMTQIKLEGIEKQIKLEEEYKNHYLNDADKQIDVDKRLIDLYQQQLDLQRQITTELDKQTAKKLEALKQEHEESLKLAEQKAKQQAFEVETSTDVLNDAGVVNAKAVADAKWDIEKQLYENKIALATKYLEEVKGNTEQEAKAQADLDNLKKEYANAERKREFELTKTNKQEAEKQKKDKEAAAKAGAAAVAGIMGGLSALMEEGSQEAKAFALMEATINTASAVVSAYKAGVATIPVPAWAGQALGIAQAAAAALQGAAQIKQIKSTSKDNPEGSGVSSPTLSAVGVSPLLDEQADLERLQSLQIYGDSQQDRDTRVYVVESDITDAQRRTEVRESEATF